MVEGEAKMRGPLRNRSNRWRAAKLRSRRQSGVTPHLCKPPRCASHDEPLYAHATKIPRTSKPDDSVWLSFQVFGCLLCRMHVRYGG